MNRDKYILNFTIGLLMGDGSYQINHWKKKYLQYRIVIKLKYHFSNIIMLQELRDYFKIGTIVVSEKYVLWAINDKKQVLYFLNLILSEWTFRISEKQYLKALKMRYGIVNNISYSEYHYNEYINCWNFEQPRKLIIDLFCEEYKVWLSGFIEAEGCYCVRKNGNMSFSIAQTNNELCIKSIKEYFDLPNKLIKRKLEEGKEQFIIETYNKKSLLKIIEYQNVYNLRGQKQESFELFKISFNKRNKCHV